MMTVEDTRKERKIDPEPQETPLKGPELEEVERRTAPRAAVIYEAIRREGEDELRRPSSALFWSGLAAGLSMGFSFSTEGLLHFYVPDVPWRPLISKFGYSIGFLIIILGRQQLFTENTLTPVLALLRNPNRRSLIDIMRLWVVVFTANLIGAFVFAWTIGHTEVFKPEFREVFRAIGMDAMRGSFYTVALRAVFAGWLIALMVWLLPFSETSRIWVIIIITYLVGIGGLSHIIAGSVDTLYVVTIGSASWADFLIRFMCPTLLGNIIGGVSLVAAINHAQVVSGEDNLQIDA